MSEAKGFEGWALVEVMGHHKFAGKVTEATIAGAGFLRLDVPESVGQQAYTKFIAPAALYALTPISEDVARGLAASYRVQPVNEWDLPRLPAPSRDAVAVEEGGPAEADVDEAGPVEVAIPPCQACGYWTSAPGIYCAQCGVSQRTWVPLDYLRDGARVWVHAMNGKKLSQPRAGVVDVTDVILDERMTGDDEHYHLYSAAGKWPTHVLPMPDDCSACDLPKPEPRVVEAVEPQPRAWTPDPLDGDDVPF